MQTILRRRYVRTWAVLVVLAVVIPGVSAGLHGGDVAAVLVFAMAAYKARLVGLDFMEIRGATTALRVSFEVYCLALWAALSGAFLLL